MIIIKIIKTLFNENACLLDNCQSAVRTSKRKTNTIQYNTIQYNTIQQG